MKTFFASLLYVLLAIGASAQYYYKDIHQTQQSSRQLLSYKENKVTTVNVQSFEADGQPTAGFQGSQRIRDNYQMLITELQSALSGSSLLTSYFSPEGRLQKTVDTTDGSSSTAEYRYSSEGLLTHISTLAVSAGDAREKEQHLWYYDESDKPIRMLRVKNDQDTTEVTFTVDENGNVVQEDSRRHGREMPVVYYYYNSENQLTDIVRYNNRARRLLPDVMFQYNDQGLLRSMLIVPEGSDDYQQWYYEYNKGGLKTKERCFNKRKQLLGTIEYTYR